jgi:hypothetical protein
VALSLVIGILVDDAIVEVENIERHLRMGKTPVPGRDGGGRRNRAGCDCHYLHTDCRVSAHGLHERHRRASFSSSLAGRRRWRSLPR